MGGAVMRVFAGVVTYNPQLERLRENLNAIVPQVEKVLVFDNGSTSVDEIVTALETYGSSIELINNGKNAGMAGALNRISKRCLDDGAHYVIMLDQDSVVPEGFVDILLEHTGDDIGITAPFIMDRNNVKIMEMDVEVEQSIMVITSGALINLEVWDQVGGYDENLFVDWVDYDYCDNVILHGYRILKIRKAVLLHEIGKKEYSHMGWSFNLKRGFFRWPVYHDDRPYSRRYDLMKAHVYVSLKYRWTPLWRHEVWFFAYDIWRNVVRERKKLEFLRALSHGVVDGVSLAHRAHARKGHAKLVEQR